MAQWQSLLSLDAAFQTQVIQLYERKFPRHIRQHLSVWIENQDWHSAAVDEQKARTCFNALLVYLEEEWCRCVKENNILHGPDLLRIKEELLNHFEKEPKSLAAILFECLEEEKKILHSAQGLVCPAEEMKPTPLDSKIAELTRMCQEITKEIEALKKLQEKFHIINAEEQSSAEAIFFVQTNQLLLQPIYDVLKTAEDAVETLITEALPEWKRRQQLACIGSPVDTSLEHLQKGFTAVANVLQQIEQHLTRLSKPNGNHNGTGDPVAEMQNSIQFLMSKLISNALVVEKQPIMSSMPSIQQPLVLKTKACFTVGLRFLINLPEFQCLLKVKPVFDKDVAEKTQMKGFRHFNFAADSSKVLDVNAAGHCLVAEFTDLVLEESKKRKSHESTLTVTEELHIITFVTDFQHAGLHCQIQASSLPVVVISATLQVPSAWASVMWYNMATSDPLNLSLFCKPPPLSWSQLSEVLSWQFLSVGKRALDQNQLAMIRDKFVEEPFGFVQWNAFSKGGCKNVWLWLDGILDLIKKHLLDLWRDGHIMGFVSREKIKELLQEKKTGTFLLRFSETKQDGAISFSWVEHHNGEARVHSIEPYTKVELATNPMPDVIFDFTSRIHGNNVGNPLRYLYPDVDKDVAFGRYCTHKDKQTPAKGPGYLPRKSINVIDIPTPPPSPPQNISMDMDMFPSTPDELFDLGDAPLFLEQQVGAFTSI